MKESGIRRIMIAIALVSSVSAVSWPADDADASSEEAEGVVFERQQVMTQLDEDTEILGKIIAGLLPASKLGETTRAIARGARDAVGAFRQQVPGGHARSETWSNYSDFMARMERFAVNAEALARAGEAGDQSAVMGMMIEALPCKECHDIYRERKRP